VTDVQEQGKGTALIAGAGIVGIATALWLQRDGWAVTLVDPHPPAEGGASAGNAGLIAVHIARPIGMPGLWRHVPAMLTDPLGPLAIRWGYLPRIAPWLLRLLLASRPGRVEAIAKALQAQLAQAWACYEPLLKPAGAEALVRRDGVFMAYRSQDDIDRSRFELDLLRRVGIELQIISGGELRERVGGLSPGYHAGVAFPGSGHTVEPLQLAKTLFQHFLAQGGQYQQVRVERFRVGPRKVLAVATTQGDIEADLFVCAAGIWSRELCRELGYRVPLDTERGYHVTLSDPGIKVIAPVVLSDAKFAVTPMLSGLRLAGTIEFGGTRAPALEGRFEALLKNARIAFPGIDTRKASRWMGFRPSFPDSLPVIGRAPRHDNMYFAFGHGHLGLTLAGVTGKALADLAGNRPGGFNLSPFRIDRFGWQ
jgi:D-amino-acid dehydrogenase